MANGRNLFNKVYPVLNGLSILISILPRGLRYWLYDLFSNTGGKIGIGIRYVFMKSLLKKCGKNVCIHPYVVIKYPEKITLGDNISIHSFSYLDGFGEISIGDNVSIAHSSSIISSNHTYNNLDLPIKYNPVIKGSIKIQDDVWIACGVRILAGITVYQRAIVAAGAVVNKNVESFTLVGGVPAKVIKRIDL